MGWIRDLDSGEGSTHQDYLFLYGLVALLQPRRILEIGTNTGVSSIVMTLAAREVGIRCEIDTIDPDEVRTATARTQFVAHGVSDQIRVHSGPSGRILPTLAGNRYDLAFVDGDHTYEGCRDDLAAVRAMTDWIVVHDTQHMPGVRRAVEEFSAAQSILIDCPRGQQYTHSQVVWQSAPGMALIRVR
ncbi:MAG: class I SAM-dependent methyltransferase [Pseudomonadota bacterium]